MTEENKRGTRKMDDLVTFHGDSGRFKMAFYFLLMARNALRKPEGTRLFYAASLQPVRDYKKRKANDLP